MQSNNLHHKNTFDAARGRRRRVIGRLRIGGSLGIWKKVGLLPKLNFNQYVYRVRNAEEAIEDLGLKSPCMYPVVVFFYNESESWSRQIDLRNGLAFCSEGCRLTNKSRTAIYGRIENSGNTLSYAGGRKEANNPP